MHLDICLNPNFVIVKHKQIFLLFIILLNSNDIIATTSNFNTSYVDYSDIIQVLEYSTNSNVYVKGSHLYNTKRRIHNGLCDNLFPDIIVEPKSTYDVSGIIKIAQKFKVPISVRSGGHSYICGSIRNSKSIEIMHIDIYFVVIMFSLYYI